MFDVFYNRTKPNLFAHERPAESIAHAQSLTRTRYFWWVDYLLDYSDFDFLWEPVPWEQHYVHAWPSQWHQYSGTFLVPAAATDIQYRFHDRVIPLRSDQRNFRTHPAAEFDYTWKPHPMDPPYIYVFGNQWYPANRMSTVEYHTPGATEKKFMPYPVAQLPQWHSRHWKTLEHCEWDYSWLPDPGDPPLIYVFGNQWWSAEKMPTVEYHVDGATDRKYMSYPRATLVPDHTHWTVPDTVDTAELDFSWVPDPGAPPYIYQFATQHQRTGGPVYTVPGATEVKYLDQLQVKSTAVATVTVEIDHLDGNTSGLADRRARFFDNYRDTLIRVAKTLVGEHEYAWIISTVCDYTNFDFTWHPEQWQSTMLHVFASDDQKFGDTFFMHVPSFVGMAERSELLEWYSVNFVDQSVPRRPLPYIKHNQDSHVVPVQTAAWSGPLAVFCTNTVPDSLPAVNLWRSETRAMIPLDRAGSTVIVPRQAQVDIRQQLYDYANIDRSRQNWMPAQLQDVVFISYDEPEADANWQLLQQRCARAQRVHGVAGMELALEAAAEVSATPWFYAVFAKTQLEPSFDFDFVPDYLQQPKHYIFDCHNVTNDLVYGHMGMVMYNCQGVREINQQGEFGLDYTLSFPHESVPILSCHADFATTPYHAWRTAFRETAKLSYFESQAPSVDGAYRLRTWISQAQGRNSEWVLRGAADGVEFFNQCQGNLALLKQSFRWEWLRDRFRSRYGELD
jgi:hypothetical protein